MTSYFQDGANGHDVIVCPMHCIAALDRI